MFGGKKSKWILAERGGGGAISKSVIIYLALCYVRKTNPFSQLSVPACLQREGDRPFLISGKQKKKKKKIG